VILIFLLKDQIQVEEKTSEQDIIATTQAAKLKRDIGLVGIGSLAEQFLIT
jgi:hypothetical protein